MKKTLLLIVAAMMSIATFAKKNTPVDKWGQLQVKGAELCDQNEKPVVLRGASLGWYNLFPCFYIPVAVKWLTDDLNATVVRSSMSIMI